MKVKIKSVEDPLVSFLDYMAIQKIFLNESAESKSYNKMLEDYPKLEMDKEETSVHHLNIRFKMIFTNVYIHNKKYQFLLDTGAQITCVSHELKDFINEERDLSVGDASGIKDTMKLGYLTEMQAFGLKVKNLPVVKLNEDQLNLKFLSKSLFHIDGILGWDLLKHLDFKLDYKNQLFLQDSVDVEQMNLIQSSFPVILLKSNGQTLYFGIDTGARKSWINESLIQDLNLKVKRISKKTVYAAHGKHVTQEKIVDKLELELGHSKIIFKDISTGFTTLVDNISLHGVLGLDVLKKHQLHVSHEHMGVDLVKPSHKFV